MGHALVSSGDFPLHRDSKGLFRISGWSASSSLYFTCYLLNAESIYGHFPNDVLCSLPKNWVPPFSCYTCGTGFHLVLSLVQLADIRCQIHPVFQTYGTTLHPVGTGYSNRASSCELLGSSLQPWVQKGICHLPSTLL